MDLPGLGGAVRLGAAVLFGLCGGLLLAGRPRTRGTLALAVACLAYAMNRILRTVEVEYFGRLERLTLWNGLSTEVATVVAAVATVVAALHYPGPLQRKHRGGVIVAAVVVVAVATYRTAYYLIEAPAIIARLDADVQLPHETLTYPLLNAFGSTFTWACWFLVAVVAERLRHAGADGRALAAVALGLPLNTAVISGGYFLATYAGLPWAALPPTFLSAASGFWMLRAADGPNARPAIVAMLGWGLAVLYGMLVVAASRTPDALSQALLSSIEGTASSVGAAVLLYGIFRLGVVELPMRRRTRRASSLAALFLVVLFALAQVLEDAVGGATGLAVGAVVAGASVLFGHRIERAARALRHRGEDERTFRHAVELAWRDREFTRDEDRKLMLLASRLGLDNERAYAIRDAVEAAKSK